jgi:hypothetical protein
MVRELHALGQNADRRLLSGGQPFDAQQELMLLRFQTRSTRRLLAKMKKTTDLITKFASAR